MRIRTYSTYEAKAKFSEIISLVREGNTVEVSYRGAPVAEIRPLPRREEMTDEEWFADLRRRGILVPAEDPHAPFASVGRVPGALQRFLDERAQGDH